MVSIFSVFYGIKPVINVSENLSYLRNPNFIIVVASYGWVFSSGGVEGSFVTVNSTHGLIDWIRTAGGSSRGSRCYGREGSNSTNKGGKDKSGAELHGGDSVCFGVEYKPFSVCGKGRRKDQNPDRWNSDVALGCLFFLLERIQQSARASKPTPGTTSAKLHRKARSLSIPMSRANVPPDQLQPSYCLHVVRASTFSNVHPSILQYRTR